MKTREQLASEVSELRRRVAELEGLKDALRESEAKYRALVEQSLQGILIIQDGRVLYANSVAAENSGYTMEEMTGLSTAEIQAQVHPEDREFVWQRLQDRLAGKPVPPHYEFRLIRKDGAVHWLELMASLIEYQGRAAVQIVLRDISERKRAEDALRRILEERLATEEALRQRSQELALLNRASQVLSSSLDLDQVLVTVLEEMRNLLHVVACSVWLIDPETDELVCRQSTDPKRDIVRGWRLSPGEGLAGWVARSGESLNVPDVRADERHFQGVDLQTGLKLRSILTVPLRAKEMVIGVLQAVDERVGRFGPADRALLESLAAAAAIAIENAQLYDQVERYAVEMGVRVAERTRELADANERLKELDRLKSKFVSDVSHELRTPIANIILYLNLLGRSKGERRSHFQTVLKDQARRLANLIEDILNLSRLELEREELEFAAVDLNAVVEKVITAQRPHAEAAGLVLTFEDEMSLPPLRAERNQLVQVVTNLVANAISYTATGHVWVRTCLDTKRGQVCLEVQDTGMGIDSQDMPHIFERFYRGERVGGLNIPGTGLGLAIVKEIVGLHGGDIEVESQPGEGSTFRVWWPLEKSGS